MSDIFAEDIEFLKNIFSKMKDGEVITKKQLLERFLSSGIVISDRRLRGGIAEFKNQYPQIMIVSNRHGYKKTLNPKEKVAEYEDIIARLKDKVNDAERKYEYYCSLE